MNDPVLEVFLNQQLVEGLELAAQSDLLELLPQALDRYIAIFRCKGLVRAEGGDIAEASEFHVGIWFPADYCRHADPFQVLTWLYPFNVFHPNIRPPLICVGKIPPSTGLCDLLFQCYEIITYFNWAPHDGLNPAACQWARGHQERFPVDRRPLKRRAIDFHVNDAARTT